MFTSLTKRSSFMGKRFIDDPSSTNNYYFQSTLFPFQFLPIKSVGIIFVTRKIAFPLIIYQKSLL